MTKVFVFGAPGSGNLRISEELYMRDDFKKSFNQDPVYKRTQFSADIAWPELKSVIDTNYAADQSEAYEIHAGWWICKFFKYIYETYPDSVFICVSRYDRAALKKIGVAGTSTEMIEKMGGEEAYKEKIDLVDAKLEKYRPKTAQEKLELRSLDSGPYKQNLADFFKDKEDEMEMTGKNEYVLTRDEVENFSPSEIEKTFNEPMEDEDDILLNRYNS
jgi:hypothetical protein